ncbi:MAG: DUF4058 family protein [Anaerolineae bacterium]|nr:DUF4058 family protein [Anaerolineae bacterium]
MEDPAEGSSVHTRLIKAISDQLADFVSPNFFVKIEQRVYIMSLTDPNRRPIVPDGSVVSGREANKQAAATTVISEPTLVEPVYEVEIRDRYIEILDSNSRDVITTKVCSFTASKAHRRKLATRLD